MEQPLRKCLIGRTRSQTKLFYSFISIVGVYKDVTLSDLLAALKNETLILNAIESRFSRRQIKNIVNILKNIDGGKNAAPEFEDIEKVLKRAHNKILLQKKGKSKKKQNRSEYVLKEKDKTCHITPIPCKVSVLQPHTADVSSCINVICSDVVPSEFTAFSHTTTQDNIKELFSSFTMDSQLITKTETTGTSSIDNKDVLFVRKSLSMNSCSDFPTELLTNTNFVSQHSQQPSLRQKDVVTVKQTDPLSDLSEIPSEEFNVNSEYAIIRTKEVLESRTEPSRLNISSQILTDSSSGQLKTHGLDTKIDEDEDSERTMSHLDKSQCIEEISMSPTSECSTVYNLATNNGENIEHEFSDESCLDVIQGTQFVDTWKNASRVNNNKCTNGNNLILIDQNTEVIIEDTPVSTERGPDNSQALRWTEYQTPIQSVSLLNYNSKSGLQIYSTIDETPPAFKGFPRSSGQLTVGVIPDSFISTLNIVEETSPNNETEVSHLNDHCPATNQKDTDMMLIDGELQEKENELWSQLSQDNMEDSDGEKSPAEQQKLLMKEIMNSRKKYEASWNGRSIKEQVSEKFAKKFHIRIFDEPVEALTNIRFKPNFGNQEYTASTMKDIHKRFKSQQPIVDAFNNKLTDIFSKMSANRKVPGATDHDSDSDQNVIENDRWLKEYFRTTKDEYEKFLASSAENTNGNELTFSEEDICVNAMSLEELQDALRKLFFK